MSRKRTRVKVGDIVTREPITFTPMDRRKRVNMQGTVVYVHPRGRYHIVEFQLGHGTVRESFWGTET